MSDATRLLRHMQAGGKVYAIDWDGTEGHPVHDGGKAIKRVAARIHALRVKGWVIDDLPRHKGLAAYELNDEAPAPDEPRARIAAAPPADSNVLFTQRAPNPYEAAA